MESMSIKMYNALKSAGATEENAQQGALVLGELEKEIINLKAGHRLTHWMVGINIMLSMAIIGFLLGK